MCCVLLRCVPLCFRPCVRFDYGRLCWAVPFNLKHGRRENGAAGINPTSNLNSNLKTNLHGVNLLQRIIRVVSHVSDVVLNPVIDKGHRKGRFADGNKQLPRRLQPQGRSFLLIEANTVLE